MLISVSSSGRVWTKQMTQPTSRMDSPDKRVRMSLMLKTLADMRSSSRICSRKFHYTWGSPARGSQNFACIDHKVFTDDDIVGILLWGICQDYLWERYYVSALEMLGPINSIWIKIPRYSVVTFSLKSKIQKQRCKFLSLTVHHILGDSLGIRIREWFVTYMRSLWITFPNWSPFQPKSSLTCLPSTAALCGSC